MSRLFKESSTERRQTNHPLNKVRKRVLTRYLLRNLRPNLRKSQLVEFILEIGNEVFKEIELVWWRVGVLKKVKNGKCELMP